MIGQLSSPAIEEVLNDSVYGHLGFRDDTDVYVLPLFYTYYNGTILGHTYDGHKVETLKDHPRVCFQVEQVNGPNDWRSVALHGSLVLLSSAEAMQAVEHIVSRFSRLPEELQGFSPFSHQGGSHTFRNDGTTPWLFRIDIDRKNGRFEKK